MQVLGNQPVFTMVAASQGHLITIAQPASDRHIREGKTGLLNGRVVLLITPKTHVTTVAEKVVKSGTTPITVVHLATEILVLNGSH